MDLSKINFGLNSSENISISTDHFAKKMHVEITKFLGVEFLSLEYLWLSFGRQNISVKPVNQL